MKAYCAICGQPGAPDRMFRIRKNGCWCDACIDYYMPLVAEQIGVGMRYEWTIQAEVDAILGRAPWPVLPARFCGYCAGPCLSVQACELRRAEREGWRIIEKNRRFFVEMPKDEKPPCEIAFCRRLSATWATPHLCGTHRYERYYSLKRKDKRATARAAKKQEKAA